MVREKQTSDVYAMKTLRKDAAARSAHGAADERAVLGAGDGRWLPKLQYAFQVCCTVVCYKPGVLDSFKIVT